GYVTNNLDCDDSQIFYADGDGDGFGGSEYSPCSGITENTDCDDNDDAITVADTIYYIDADGDGYGNAAVSITSCVPVEGYVLDGSDCDDLDGDVYRKATFFVDQDGDGYSTGDTVELCYGANVPNGYAATNLGFDCNDEIAAINSGATEILYNGIDD